MDSDLSEKTAFVTGGSAGIGAATVRMLAEAGSTVVVGYNKLATNVDFQRRRADTGIQWVGVRPVRDTVHKYVRGHQP